jgi:hypothetical protein
MRHYCSCGNRYIVRICKSATDIPPLECNSDCWKKQRDKKLEEAFKSKEFDQNKMGMKIEYYPDDALEFAIKYPKFAHKVEEYLTEVALEKQPRSFVNLQGERRNFVMMYVYEHFKLEMCTFGGKVGHTSITDVTWKEGCKVPDILASEIVDLIQRGIITGEMHENRKLLFEATLVVYNLQKGSSIDDLKKLLVNFEGDFYPERRTQVNNRTV